MNDYAKHVESGIGEKKCENNFTDNSEVYPNISVYDFMNLVTIKDYGCWEWNKSRSEKRGGYGQKRIGGRKNGKNFKSHRLAWWIFHGDPGKYFVCHKCDNPPCCNPEHLFLGTAKDNSHDMHEKNRGFIPKSTRGEENKSSKLLESDVHAIRIEIKKGISLNKISKQYKITKQSVWRIKKQKSWAWLQ